MKHNNNLGLWFWIRNLFMGICTRWPWNQ